MKSIRVGASVWATHAETCIGCYMRFGQRLIWEDMGGLSKFSHKRHSFRRPLRTCNSQMAKVLVPKANPKGMGNFNFSYKAPTTLSQNQKTCASAEACEWHLRLAGDEHEHKHGLQKRDHSFWLMGLRLFQGSSMIIMVTDGRRGPTFRVGGWGGRG